MKPMKFPAPVEPPTRGEKVMQIVTIVLLSILLAAVVMVFLSWLTDRADIKPFL